MYGLEMLLWVWWLVGVVVDGMCCVVQAHTSLNVGIKMGGVEKRNYNKAKANNRIGFETILRGQLNVNFTNSILSMEGRFVDPTNAKNTSR